MEENLGFALERERDFAKVGFLVRRRKNKNVKDLF